MESSSTGTQGATTIGSGILTAGMVAPGELLESLNGLHDAVTLAGGGNTSVATAGSTITISSSGVTAVSAGSGITVTNGSTTPTVSASFGGSGAAGTVARSDHDHIGQSWTCGSTDCQTLALFSSDTSVNSAALVGMVTSSTAEGVGVWGETRSSDSQSAGVFAWALNGAGKGIWAEANGATGSAVYARGTNGARAGWFEGDVYVSGTLSKSAGSFKIDDPIDPAHKYLSHSFVESPDMKNLYDGVAVLDASGEARVQLPDWFEPLNQDFRYQLTAIGRPMPELYVAEEITGNQFRIAGGAPGAKVSWQVTGTRHDAYAQAHRIPVEEVKPLAEQGTYLFPEGFGADASKSISGAIRRTNAPRSGR